MLTTVNGIAYPLQLIKDPMAPASRHLNPNANAAPAHARNLDEKATRQIRIVYPQAIPVLRRPRFVLRPERVKY